MIRIIFTACLQKKIRSKETAGVFANKRFSPKNHIECSKVKQLVDDWRILDSMRQEKLLTIISYLWLMNATTLNSSSYQCSMSLPDTTNIYDNLVEFE